MFYYGFLARKARSHENLISFFFHETIPAKRTIPGSSSWREIFDGFDLLLLVQRCDDGTQSPNAMETVLG